MSREVLWLPRARRDLKKLDPPIQRRIVQAVKSFSDSGQGDVKRLTAINPPEYRLRVGDWRVRFAAGAKTAKTEPLEILRVLHRSKAY